MNKPLTIIADDLTGACEIAAICHQHGIQSVVSMDLSAKPGDQSLIVYDTETRLDPSFVASAKIESFSRKILPQRDSRLIFKKVDSVMRGPIAAELNCLAEILDFPRVLLVPANPGLGRTIKNGFYRIHNIPLDQTPFARDLHHPITSPWVSDMLGASAFLPVHRAAPTDELPGKGIIIGDATSPEDFEKWTPTISEGTLPAGSAAFFETVLEHWTGKTVVDTGEITLAGKHLLISGTTHPVQQAMLKEFESARAGACTRRLSQVRRDSARKWAADINQALGKADCCLVYVDSTEPPDPAKSTVVRDTLAMACAYVAEAGQVHHIVAEGGATAAFIARRMNWMQLEVVHTWAAGIVTLRPLNQPGILFTMKPGSYPWPESFTQQLFNSTLLDTAKPIS